MAQLARREEQVVWCCGGIFVATKVCSMVWPVIFLGFSGQKSPEKSPKIIQIWRRCYPSGGCDFFWETFSEI
jgi:hypothetical protein